MHINGIRKYHYSYRRSAVILMILKLFYMSTLPNPTLREATGAFIRHCECYYRLHANIDHFTCHNHPFPPLKILREHLNSIMSRTQRSTEGQGLPTDCKPTSTRPQTKVSNLPISLGVTCVQKVGFPRIFFPF